MARANVVTETLTDRSKVYNVTMLLDDGKTVTFDCIDKPYAVTLADSLNATTYAVVSK